MRYAAPLLILILSVPLHAQVAISELCANNHTTLQDADGESSDWIELENTSGSILDISGYYVTDDPTDLTKWEIPATTLLGSAGRVLLFASGKDGTIGGQRHTNFSLSSGGEYLAVVAPNGTTIVHELTPTYPQQYPDVSWGRVNGTNDWGYFTNPTPATVNASVASSVGTDLTWSPALPGDADAITVTATALPRPGATIASAQLRYRVGFGGEVGVTMTQSFGQWSATIPASASGPGDMVRWRVVFTDSGAVQTTLPLYPAPNDSPQYAGVMIPDPSVNTSMKTMYWFMQNTGAANNTTGGRASVWYEGVLYDNILARARGNSSLGWPKKSHKFDFNPGYHLQIPFFGGGVEELNANSTWGDKSFMRQILCAEMYETLGAATSRAFPMRLQRNGTFYSVVNAVEQPDRRYLERNGLDRYGALYKMFNQATSSSSGVEKKTRLWENNGDLGDLISNISQPTGVGLENWLFDNVDVPACISYLVATCLVHDNDHVAKNYYVYRDSDGDGEWRFLPWDKDLTWGRNYTLFGGVLNDTIWTSNDPYSHPLFGDQQHPKVDGPWNRFIDALYRTPRIRQMYFRRLRSAMDSQLLPPGTPAGQLPWENRITQLQTAMSADCALDQAAWGVPSYGSGSLNFLNASNQIATTYLAGRRAHLYNNHGPNGSALIPGAATGSNPITIASIEASPGSPDEAYVELRNCGPDAVDASGWTVSGDVSFSFPAGTVVLPGESLFVAADVPGFRGRATSPTGGEGHLVVGPWSGAISPVPSILVFDAGNGLITNAGDFSFQVATTGSGDLTLAIGGAAPNSPFWIPVSFDTSNPIGCGPVLGLGADAFLTLALPANSPPFNGTTDFAGGYLFVAPAGTIPPGLTADGRAVVLNPTTGQFTLSRILRVSF